MISLYKLNTCGAGPISFLKTLKLCENIFLVLPQNLPLRVTDPLIQLGSFRTGDCAALDFTFHQSGVPEDQM